MRFSKKLLTALLPIAATGAVVPVVTSCNKGSGYVINFGDEINCLDEKGKNYHSLDDVKNTIKSKAPFEQDPSIPKAKLPTRGESLLNKQTMYYDLVASLSILASVKFILTWSVSENVYSISLNAGDGVKTGNSLSYIANEDTTISIAIMDNNDVAYSTKSNCFKNTRIV